MIPFCTTASTVHSLQAAKHAPDMQWQNLRKELLGQGDIVYMNMVGRRQLRTVIRDVALVSRARRTLVAWQLFRKETNCHITGGCASVQVVPLA